MVEIEGFLNAYWPKSICLPCLAKVTSRSENDVRIVVMTMVAERRVETQAGECLNCNVMAFVVRRRRGEG